MANDIVDIAHVSFLEMIRALGDQVGPTSTKGMLVRNAVRSGTQMPHLDFPAFDDFVRAIDAGENPITHIEGKAQYVGDGVFGLPLCPFANSIASFKKVFGTLPDNYAEVTAEFNKAGPVTGALCVGHGAGASPFCSVHQPMRSAVGQRITIGGAPVAVYQLGCKAASGAKAFADPLIAEFGCPKELVDKVLDTNMCCYGVKVMPPASA
jgi:hypothetical protein